MLRIALCHLFFARWRRMIWLKGHPEHSGVLPSLGGFSHYSFESSDRDGESVNVPAQLERPTGATDNVDEICGEPAQCGTDFAQGLRPCICFCIHSASPDLVILA